MIDPKMVELGIYNGIPHLLIPVVTDPKKAAGALQWAVDGDDASATACSPRRGVRDLDSYNNALAESEPERADAAAGRRRHRRAGRPHARAPPRRSRRRICRVAQMGRAAGMHLVIATQRPSADVITGLMKANIP